MRRRFFASLASLPLAALCAAPSLALAQARGTAPPDPAAPPVTLPGTQALSVRGGPARDREYRLLVSLPAGKTVPAKGYPVLFVLDGNAHFGAFHDARRAGPAFAETMVVSVGYPTEGTHDFLRRSYDFSPPAPAGEKPPQGGDDEFLDTLEQVVIPEIARRHPLDRDRLSLFGHSFGGMFAMHALFTRPMLFTHYVSASPSLWWRDDYLLPQERRFAARVAAGEISPVHQSLLLVIGERETPQEIQDAQALAQRLAPLSAYGLRTAFHLQPGEDHMSLPIAIAPTVLRQVFSARSR